MTCIVGIAEKGIVTLGGDSAGVSGWDVSIRKDSKVFKTGEFVIGFTDSFRMGQILKHCFIPPPFPENEDDLERYMSTLFVDRLREIFKEKGYAERQNDREGGGTFLVGIKGRLFKIASDYQVGESMDEFDAVGSGAQVALGSLLSTRSIMVTHQRLYAALHAAEYFNIGVRPPFNFISGP